MPRVILVLAVACFALVSLFGCQQAADPVAVLTERVKLLEASHSLLEEEGRAAASARDRLRKELAAAWEQIKLARADADANQSAARERDEFRALLAGRTAERDQARAERDGVRRELAARADERDAARRQFAGLRSHVRDLMGKMEVALHDGPREAQREAGPAPVPPAGVLSVPAVVPDEPTLPDGGPTTR